MSTHLFVQSCYTLLDSVIRIPDLVRKAKQLGYTSVALTDADVLYGAAAFIRQCAAEGIHGIVGMQVKCLYHEDTVPFLLLAKDNQGYADLIRLSGSLSSGRETCSTEELIRCCRHCFLIVYGEGGWFDRELVADNREAISAKLKIMKEELPAFDIALSYQEASLWKLRNAALKRIAASLSLKTVALNKIYYLEDRDAEVYRIVRGIRENKNLSDHTLGMIRGRHFLSPREMSGLYDPDDLQRSDEIAAECRADYNLGKTYLPAFQTPAGYTSQTYLPELCMAGLRKRLAGKADPVYIERLKYELGVIHRMNFEDYFLIVYDFIRYARKNGIRVGPGRGSAAGSLVAYCLGITQVDPVKYNLLFERFLNPERVSMPDIDTDIPDDRREEVIRYVWEKYGADHVANIIAFGTLRAKQAVRDVGKVMNMNIRDVETISRLIPNIPGITLQEAYNRNARLKQYVDSEKKYADLYSMARRLEGLPRHTTLHAAGVVMSGRPLEEVVPVTGSDGEMKTSQFSMEYLEERGLIKMDFLGLRNLTILDEIVHAVQKDDPSFRIEEINLEEPGIYRLFRRADTEGIFQFESEGMKNLLRRMQPESFADVTAALALYRPASADSIPDYLTNKQAPEKIVWPLKELEPVLKETYGVMVFQEQAMKTAEIAAGFSLGRADVLRKAMSKKNEKEMNALHDEFTGGCIRNGIPAGKAEELFSLVSRFSGYGFNKSHAVAYGMIACQMAYLKALYPADFYCAVLNSVIGSSDKTARYIEECRRRKIGIIPPGVNDSGKTYIKKDRDIILPLSIIRSVGIHTASAIADERETNGLFTDFFDFTARMLVHKTGTQVFESLIDAGALDCFSLSRRTMREGLEDAVRYGELVQISSGTQITIDLNLVAKPVLMNMKDSEEETSRREQEALGFNIGVQPIEIMRQKYGIREPSLSVIRTMNGTVYGFACIRYVNPHRTKKGDMMAFLKIYDETGEIDMAVMPRLYSRTSSFLIKGTYIRFCAKISDDRSLLADRIEVIQKK